MDIASKPGLIGWKRMRPRIGDPAWSTVWEWERAGLFPRRVKLHPGQSGRCAWDEASVDRWIQEKLEAK